MRTNQTASTTPAPTPAPIADPYRPIKIALDRLHDPIESLARTTRASAEPMSALRDEITKLIFCYESIVKHVSRLR
jgi:hypothetical protein